MFKILCPREYIQEVYFWGYVQVVSGYIQGSRSYVQEGMSKRSISMEYVWDYVQAVRGMSRGVGVIFKRICPRAVILEGYVPYGYDRLYPKGLGKMSR